MHQSQITKDLPPKFVIFDVKVSATNYDEAQDIIIEYAKNHKPIIVDHMPVHGLISAVTDPHFKNALNNFDIVAPDGQPVRWALNLLYKTNLKDRVYGPELMLRLCERAANDKVSIYLYGSTEKVLAKLKQNLLTKFPSLLIVGLESPPFRPLSEKEVTDTINRINDSKCGILFLGLGCPKQEIFAFEHKNNINAVQMCVGAAFDFHAGTVKQAPPWMQKRGLEWAYRFFQEPKRLWKRYLVTNTLFLFLLIKYKFRPPRDH